MRPSFIRIALLGALICSVSLVFGQRNWEKGIPQDTFKLDFYRNGTYSQSLYFKYLEYKIEDAPQLMASLSPMGIWAASGDAGFGPLFGLSYRPVKEFDLRGNIMVPFFHFYGKNTFSGPNTRRFFAAEVYPTVFFLTSHRMKERKIKLAGSYSYGYSEILVMKVPTVSHHQLGFRPGYTYWQGNAYENPGFRSHILSGGLVYRKIKYHVFHIRGKGHRIMSSQFDIFGDFMLGMSLKSLSGNGEISSGPGEAMGGRGGFEYGFGMSHTFPLYLKIRGEGGYAPSLASKAYVQFSFSVGFGIDKTFRNKYDKNYK